MPGLYVIVRAPVTSLPTTTHHPRSAGGEGATTRHHLPPARTNQPFKGGGVSKKVARSNFSGRSRGRRISFFLERIKGAVAFGKRLIEQVRNILFWFNFIFIPIFVCRVCTMWFFCTVFWNLERIRNSHFECLLGRLENDRFLENFRKESMA